MAARVLMRASLFGLMQEVIHGTVNKYLNVPKSQFCYILNLATLSISATLFPTSTSGLDQSYVVNMDASH